MIHKKFVALLITGFATVLVLQNLLSTPLQALEIAPLADIVEFNANLDRETFRPENIEQSDEPLGGARAIIGEDEREPVLSRAFPWSAVGRLEWQLEGDTVSSCTATLVHPDIILTNAHCLLLPYRREGSDKTSKVFIDTNRYERLLQSMAAVPKLVFKPSMINGVALDESAVVAIKTGWEVDDYAPTEDWALMKLNAPLGNKYGYLGWRDLDLSSDTIVEALVERTNLIGYSGDFPTESLREFGQASTTAGVDRACSVLGLWKSGPLVGTIAHDCDTNPGASGGPILVKFANGQYYIIGLHARQTPLNRTIRLPNGVSTSTVNGGVQVRQWAETTR